MTKTLGPYRLGPGDTESWGVVTGDAKTLCEAMPNESVDLILTDPIYQNVKDYEWLAEMAGRVLKKDGNALAFVNAKWFPLCFLAAPTKLPPLVYVQTSGPSPMNGRIIAKSYYLLWWGSGKLVGYMPDGYVGTSWSKAGSHNHKWTKNPKYIKAVLKAFTREGAIILDPFAGGGTIPSVARMRGRRWLAFEIKPEIADLARQRIANTQSPLPGLTVTQAEMEL